MKLTREPFPEVANEGNINSDFSRQIQIFSPSLCTRNVINGIASRAGVCLRATQESDVQQPEKSTKGYLWIADWGGGASAYADLPKIWGHFLEFSISG